MTIDMDTAQNALMLLLAYNGWRKGRQLQSVWRVLQRQNELNKELTR